MACLPKLRTLNIRNMPFVADLDILVDNVFETAALLFVEQAIRARTCHGDDIRQGQIYMSDPPSLKIITLGVLTYCDVWDGSIADSCTQRDDYLTPRIYAIDYRKISRGLWAAPLSQVARGSTSKIQDTYSDISILQPYWLSHGHKSRR